MAELADTCPSGLYVARLTRQATVDVNAPRRVLADAVGTQPRMPGLTGALVVTRLRASGALLWVATLCGYVVLCAEAGDLVEGPNGTVRFVLAEPGAWADSLQARRLATRPGRPWLLLEPGGVGLSARGGR